MKAVSLWQPWASLIAIGAKPHETRSWATAYRGPIAIHAAVKPAHEMDLATIYACRQAFNLPHEKPLYDYLRELPHGAIVATATLTECWRVVKHTATAIILKQSNGIGEDKIPIDEPYLFFGDYSVGRYILGLAEINALPRPVPAKGRQRIWNWEGE